MANILFIENTSAVMEYCQKRGEMANELMPKTTPRCFTGREAERR